MSPFFFALVMDRGVIGLLIVDENGKVLRTTMNKQDRDQNPIQIAKKVTELAKKARSVVRDIDPQDRKSVV